QPWLDGPGGKPAARGPGQEERGPDAPDEGRAGGSGSAAVLLSVSAGGQANEGADHRGQQQDGQKPADEDNAQAGQGVLPGVPVPVRLEQQGAQGWAE